MKRLGEAGPNEVVERHGGKIPGARPEDLSIRVLYKIKISLLQELNKLDLYAIVVILYKRLPFPNLCLIVVGRGATLSFYPRDPA